MKLYIIGAMLENNKKYSIHLYIFEIMKKTQKVRSWILVKKFLVKSMRVDILIMTPEVIDQHCRH